MEDVSPRTLAAFDKLNTIIGVHGSFELLRAAVTEWRVERKLFDVGSGGIFSLDEMDSIFGTQQFKVEDLALFKDGKRLDPMKLASFPPGGRSYDIPDLNKDRIGAALNDGYSIKFNEVQRWSEALGEIIRLWSRMSLSRISLNAYYTRSGQRCFDPHKDREWLLVCQIAGDKDWYIGADATSGLAGKPTLTLGPGDVLMIAKNILHGAVCGPAPSLHLTFGFEERQIGEYMETLRESAELGPLLQKPLAVEPEARSRQIDQLAEALKRALSDEENFAEFRSAVPYDYRTRSLKPEKS